MPDLRTTTLRDDERFPLWGRIIHRIKYDRFGDDEQFVSLYARDGYLGSIRPSSCVEVMNIIEDRKTR